MANKLPELKVELPQIPTTAKIQFSETTLNQIVGWAVKEQTGYEVAKVDYQIDRDGEIMSVDVTVKL